MVSTASMRVQVRKGEAGWVSDIVFLRGGVAVIYSVLSLDGEEEDSLSQGPRVGAGIIAGPTGGQNSGGPANDRAVPARQNIPLYQDIV